MDGKSGYDAFVGDVNWVSVAVSAIPGGGLVATVAKEAVKATVKVSINNGVSVEKDIKKIAKATVVNSAISVGAKSATTKIKASSSDEALKAAKKTANTAQIGVKKATTQVAKKPNSINASVALDKAKSVALEARKTEVRTQMANSTVNKVLTVTVANNQKLGEKVVEKTIKTVTQKVVNDGKK